MTCRISCFLGQPYCLQTSAFGVCIYHYIRHVNCIFDSSRWNYVIHYRFCVTNEHWYVWFVLIAGHFICPRSSTSWLSLVEQVFIYHLCMSKSSFNGVAVAQMWTIVCRLFFLILTFVLRYVGSGNTNVVFRLSVCLLGLTLSLYLVRISYVVVIWILIRLHQSNQALSTSWQALFICKYQIPSIFHVVTCKTLIYLVNDPFYIQPFYARCDYVKKVLDMMVNNSININKTTPHLKITAYNKDHDI